MIITYDIEVSEQISVPFKPNFEGLGGPIQTDEDIVFETWLKAENCTTLLSKTVIADLWDQLKENNPVLGRMRIYSRDRLLLVVDKSWSGAYLLKKLTILEKEGMV